MPKNHDGVTAFLIESIERAIGDIRQRPMFGGVGLWKGEAFFGMVSDGALSIRLDEADEPAYLEIGFVPNDPSSAGKDRKRYYEVPADVLEDRHAIKQWLDRAVTAARG